MAMDRSLFITSICLMLIILHQCFDVNIMAISETHQLSWAQTCNVCNTKDYRVEKNVEFEPDLEKCVIPLAQNMSELNKVVGKQNRTKNCTLNFFSEYFKNTHQYYGQGIWFKPTVEFRPKHCNFHNFTGSRDSFASCLKQKNITKILVTGDSTARLLQLNNIKVFKGWNCKKVRSSEANPYNRTKEEEYFSVPGVEGRFLNAQFCGFLLTCHSWEYVCTTPGDTHQVSVEYISSTHLVDLALSIKKHAKTPYISAHNKLEYVLKYYLPSRGFPDLWLFDLPFRHDTWWTTVDSVRIDIDYVLQLLQLWLPKSSRIVFLSDSRECPNLMNGNIVNIIQQKFQRSRNTRLHQYNQVFYKTFTNFISDNPNFYAFLDDVRLTCNMMCEFQRDAAHYTDIYYRRFNEYIFDSVCAQNN